MKIAHRIFMHQLRRRADDNVRNAQRRDHLNRPHEQSAHMISYPSIDDCMSIKRQAFSTLRDKDAVVDDLAEAVSGSGTLTDRIVNVLRIKKMGLGKLASTLKHDPNMLSPILTRLVRKGRVIRRGAERNSVYEAA